MNAFSKNIWLGILGCILLILSGFSVWKGADYKMPTSWFKLTTQKGYNSLPGKLESWRLSLIRKQWEEEAMKLNLVGRWRSKGCRDGEFFCEFTKDGKFFISPKDEDSRTAVLWSPLNGCPYERFYDGYTVPAGRFGGDPFRKNGVVFGEAFRIYEPNDQFTSGWIATDGEMVEVTFDSLQYGIVYEKMLLERLPAEQVADDQLPARAEAKVE